MTKMEIKFLSALKKLEGGKLHHVQGEPDITTGYGIAKDQNPNVSIFTMINNVASSNNIKTDSKKWTKEELALIQSKIDPNSEKELTLEFYQDFISKGGIDITQLPEALFFGYSLIYINSPKIAKESLQESVNTFICNIPELESIVEIKELVVDGKIGKGTRGSVYSLSRYIATSTSGNLLGKLWLSYFMSSVKSSYIELATDALDSKGQGYDKHLQYLKGWDRRCNLILRGDV